MKKIIEKVLVFFVVIVLSMSVAGATTCSAASSYTFKYKKVTAKMNGKAKKLLKKAGKIEKKKVSKSCAYEGYDRTYLFKHFMVSTYSKTTKGAEYINCIKLRTSKVATREGIKLGSSKNDVFDAYGRTDDVYGVYTYVKGKSKLQIEITDDVVTAISYIAR